LKTAIVILNWNGKKYLAQFLPKVVKSAKDIATVIVADNASDDDSVAFVTTHFPEVRIIQNSSNGGFSKGYNEALRQVEAEYYVLLNSDVEVETGWIEPVISLMDRNPSIACCQPKIRDYMKRNLFEYAGAAGGFMDKYGYPFCRGRIFHTIEEDQGQYNDQRQVFWSTGACLFVRSSIYHQVGGLDEDFFAHMEEIDLCWRIKNRGYEIWYCPESTVYHVGGGTLNKINPRKTFLNFRNNMIMLCKNHAPAYFWIKLFIRMILDGIAGIKFLLSGDFMHCMAVIKAHFSFYSSFGKTLRKRKQEKKSIKNYATTGVYNRSIVFDFFAGNQKKFSQLDKNAFQ
jgi:GT2 family glycosyltransferase